MDYNTFAGIIRTLLFLWYLWLAIKRDPDMKRVELRVSYRIACVIAALTFLMLALRRFGVDVSF